MRGKGSQGSSPRSDATQRHDIYAPWFRALSLSPIAPVIVLPARMLERIAEVEDNAR